MVPDGDPKEKNGNGERIMVMIATTLEMISLAIEMIIKDLQHKCE